MSQILEYYRKFQQQSQQAPAPQQPMLQDLSIDDNLPEIDRLVRYTKSPIALQRLVHVKMLADIAISVGFELANELVAPLLNVISNDVEPVVRQHLVEQFFRLSKFFIENGGVIGYRLVLSNIIPLTAQLLEDEKFEVRQAAVSVLVAIGALINYDDLGQHILTVVLRMAHDDSKEEMRMTASELLNLLAECFGLDLCKQFIIPEVVSLAEDPVFRVRKSVALNLHNICKIGGEHELFERLMPAFVRLSKDDMYRVRRACADSLSDVAKNVSDDIRVGVLVEIFLRLAQDPSKLVKQSILKQSGTFISTLPSRAVNDIILSHFCSMATGPTGDATVDSELMYWCAYSFPAVLQKIGPSRWPAIKEVYQTLVQSRVVDVKTSLALSLHEIARILGSSIVEEDLVAIFEGMIQDVEAVQIGVIKHLAEFFKLLSEPCRVSYLPLLHELLNTTNPFNWRLRQSLASQLSDLVMLPPPQTLFNTLFSLVMNLLQDPVATVRKESFKGVATMIHMLYIYFEEENMSSSILKGFDEVCSSSESLTNKAPSIYEQYVEAITSAINALVYGETYQQRQLWVELCSQLLCDLPRTLFEKYFIDGILILTSDPISNVRVVVAQLLVGWEPYYPAPWHSSPSRLVIDDMNDSINDADSKSSKYNKKLNMANETSPWVWLLQRSDICECIHRLSVDDRDVIVSISKLQPLFPTLEFVSKSCLGMKIAPGGERPVERYDSVNGKMLKNSIVHSIDLMNIQETTENSEFFSDANRIILSENESSATIDSYKDGYKSEVISKIFDFIIDGPSEPPNGSSTEPFEISEVTSSNNELVVVSDESNNLDVKSSKIDVDISTLELDGSDFCTLNDSNTLIENGESCDTSKLNSNEIKVNSSIILDDLKNNLTEQAEIFSEEELIAANSDNEPNLTDTNSLNSTCASTIVDDSKMGVEEQIENFKYNESSQILQVEIDNEKLTITSNMNVPS